MTTISIEITPTEKSRLLTYCEGVHDSGHWGDGAVELPDEKIFADRVAAAGPSLALTLRDMEILHIHIEDSTDHGSVLLPEDLSIIGKIIPALDAMRRSSAGDRERITGLIQSFTEFITGRRAEPAPSPNQTLIAESVPPPTIQEPTAGVNQARADSAGANQPSSTSGKKGLLARIMEFINPSPGSDAMEKKYSGTGETFEERARRAKAAAKRLGKMR